MRLDQPRWEGLAPHPSLPSLALPTNEANLMPALTLRQSGAPAAMGRPIPRIDAPTVRLMVKPCIHAGAGARRWL